MKENVGWPECRNWDVINERLQDNTMFPRRLAFAPDNNVTRRILQRTSQTLNFKGIPTYSIFRPKKLSPV